VSRSIEIKVYVLGICYRTLWFSVNWKLIACRKSHRTVYHLSTVRQYTRATAV